MDIKEAREMIEAVEVLDDPEMEEAHKMAALALDKQIEKEPTFKTVTAWIGENEYQMQVPTCPACGVQIVNHGNGWVCTNSKCRQAIKYDGRQQSN